MSNVLTFKKILKVLEQEKKEAQLVYQVARNKFEEVAQQLYEQLKAKENAEVDFKAYIQTEASIIKVKDQANYIENIKSRIIFLQNNVNNARVKMEEKQVVLTEAHVEVKKIESVIDKREAEQIQLEKKLEIMSLDEISIRQYIDAK